MERTVGPWGPPVGVATDGAATTGTGDHGFASVSGSYSAFMKDGTVSQSTASGIIQGVVVSESMDTFASMTPGFSGAGYSEVYAEADATNIEPTTPSFAVTLLYVGGAASGTPNITSGIGAWADGLILSDSNWGPPVITIPVDAIETRVGNGATLVLKLGSSNNNVSVYPQITGWAQDEGHQGNSFGAAGSYTWWVPTPPETASGESPYIGFGDFNFDGALDASDIDTLTQYVRDHIAAGNHWSVIPRGPGLVGATPFYDINGDLNVQASYQPPGLGTNDLTQLVREELGTEFGDADLDGDVDVLDLDRLTFGWGTDAGWSYGDFNGDGTVDNSDYTILLTHFGYSSQQGLSAVPEPTSCYAVICLALLVHSRRRF
ncbi:MAG: hypothetical protein AAGJ46_01370 [Planctomycetota bacterium]